MTAKTWKYWYASFKIWISKVQDFEIFELSPMWYPYLMTVLGYMHFEE